MLNKSQYRVFHSLYKPFWEFVIEKWYINNLDYDVDIDKGNGEPKEPYRGTGHFETLSAYDYLSSLSL